MKKQLKSILLVALFIGMGIPAWSQSSTQGKEFWVAMIPAKGPDSSDPTNTGQFKPYIAVSAAKACKVTISNPNTGWTDVFDIATDNTWVERNIPLEQWYQRTIPASETIYNNGIKVTATEDVSVYCALRWSKSMDASNILPVTALQSEYLVEAYAPSTKDGDKRNVFTVLAAEDCSVSITPACQTEKGKPANTTFNVDLKAGQVYHVISKEGESISGSQINAHGKSIAVFAGDILGNVPTSVADRDLLYEQLFPIDYWGTDFVVTRSLEKDANRIKIVALENGTDVTIFGAHQATSTSETIEKTNYELTLQAGQAYEFELSTGYKAGKWDTNKRATLKGINVTDNSAYIHTSCPCAVFSYDVGNSYVTKVESEEVNSKGAPSMTWVSPVQQMMKDVVFGVMGTNNTHDHFINIIVRTESVKEIKMDGKSIESDFIPVESNAEYSYARKRLAQTTTGQQNPTYHLECESGFIATIYGNGDDESYAYSVGSSAIKQGVTIDNFTFTGGISDHKLCLGDDFNFTPKVEGTYRVSRVIWNFGDGIIQEITSSTDDEDLAKIPVSHPYVTPGWYDVSAIIYGNKVCPAGSYEKIGDISFSFYVSRPDTIYHTRDSCVAPDYTGEMAIIKKDTFGCDSVVVSQFFLHRKSLPKDSLIQAQDAYTLKGITYTTSTVVEDTLLDKFNCDSIIRYNIQIVKCLDMQIENKPAEQEVCAGENLDIPFSYSRDGGYTKAYLYKVIQDPTSPEGYRLTDKTPVTIEEKGEAEGRKNGLINLPISAWRPGYYVGCIQMEDANCKIVKDGIEQPAIEQSTALNITIKYPETIIAFKFNNVLAVYQKGFGGNKGYDFVAYQWYRNGEEIDALKNPSAATSVYHSEEIFKTGDEYYVRLTESGKEPLVSCSFTVPENLDDYSVKKDDDTNPKLDDNNGDNLNTGLHNHATKKFVNRRICVEFDGRTYDMYGQRVK